MILENLFVALLSAGMVFSVVSLIYCTTQLAKVLYKNFKDLLNAVNL